MGTGNLGDPSQGLYCLVEVSPFCLASINIPEPGVTSGEAGWTVRGAHLHHALGTSQVRASGPDPGLGSDCIIGAVGAHLDHLGCGPPGSRGQGPEPINYHCACQVVG